MKIASIIKKVFSSGGTLSKKTAQSTFWLFSLRVADHSVGFVRIIILARLLAPGDFGLFGIAMMAVSLLETFSQHGFQKALTQKKEDIGPYLNTAWVVAVTRSLLLALLLFFMAPFVAVFFKAPGAEQLLKVVSIAVALQGFYNIAIVYFSKELEFHKYFFYQIIGTLTDGIVSVAFAFMLRTAWALVFGMLAGVLARLIISYVVHPYYPRFIFSFSKARELFNFGKWVLIADVVAFFTMQADGFFVAKLLGISALGFYQIAYKIPSILAVEIIASAIFPAYAKIQDNIVKIKETYLKILRLFSFLLMPMAGGILMVIPEFIRLFLGEKWLPSVAPMQVLVVSSLIWTISVLSNYVFLALGKPGIEAKGVAIRLVALTALLYPFITWWGIFGASLAVLMSVLLSASWFIFMILKTIDCQLKDFLKNLIIPFVNALSMVLIIGILKSMVPITMWSFFLVIMVGILMYVTLTYITDKFLKQKMIPLLKESVSLLIK